MLPACPLYRTDFKEFSCFADILSRTLLSKADFNCPYRIEPNNPAYPIMQQIDEYFYLLEAKQTLLFDTTMVRAIFEYAIAFRH